MPDPQRFNGYSDLPTSQDALGMAKKYDGLARFICECETPMTIAINGDWGSGKSSAMKIIQKRLNQLLRDGGGQGEAEENSPQIIEFNTWEFSIVNDNSKLVFELLQTLNEKLTVLEKGAQKPEAERAGKILSFFTVTGNALKDLTVKAINESDAKFLFTFLKGLGGQQGNEAAGESFTYTSPTKLLQTVSRSIGERIDSIVRELERQHQKYARLFVFIDDLDRLEPRIALELIEGMKNFADYKNCVFILAVDQQIVERGLKAKYGDEFSDEMARHFFDKIIQVPFSLPMNAYKLDGYILSLLQNSPMTRGEQVDRDTARRFAALLNSFGQRNPRTIKRSFNLLQMYQCMEAGGMGEAPAEAAMEKTFRQYAVLLLLLTQKNEHTRLTQMSGSGGQLSDEEALRLGERFLSLGKEDREDQEPSPYTQAVLDVFYPEGKNDLNATRDLVNALRCTSDGDADSLSYAAAEFLLAFFRRLEESPAGAEIAASCPEWREIKENTPTVTALAGSKQSLRSTLYLTEDTTLRFTRSIDKRARCTKEFFFTLRSPLLNEELPGRFPHLRRLEDGTARQAPGGDLIEYYYVPGGDGGADGNPGENAGTDRITVFLTGQRHTEEVFQLLEDCGVFSL